jgi:hypothetical protein
MTYVIINYRNPQDVHRKDAAASACCICVTEKRAKDKAAGLARDHIAEMVKDGILDNCMEVDIVEQNHGFELYHDKNYCNGEFICGFTVSEVDTFDPPELEVKININSGQFGDAVQPGDTAYYKEGGRNV